MMLSNVKYQDPTRVLSNIVDDFGQKMVIRDQMDYSEFYLNFVDRLQDGLGENKALIRKQMNRYSSDISASNFGSNLVEISVNQHEEQKNQEQLSQWSIIDNKQLSLGEKVKSSGVETVNFFDDEKDMHFEDPQSKTAEEKDEKPNF